MLLVKLATGYFCSWWTLKVDKAVYRARKIQKHEDHSKKIIKTNKHKKRIIHKVKILQFQNNIHQTAFSSKNIWKLMKWVKKHSHFFFKLSVISLLQTETEKVMQTATSSENKAKMLWEQFFSLKSQTDFSNMKNYYYLLKIKLILRVNKMNVF